VALSGLVAHIFDGAIVSRLCTNAKLAEHIVDSVDNRLRLFLVLRHSRRLGKHDFTDGK